MVIVTVVNVYATGDGLVNIVTAQLTLTPVFLRMEYCVVEEVNAFVEHVFAQIPGPRVAHVKDALHVVILVVPNGKVLFLPCLYFLLHSDVYSILIALGCYSHHIFLGWWS